MSQRNDIQAYPQTNLSTQLLQHQQQMLKFLFFTGYDIIYQTFQLKHGSYSQRNRGHITQSYKTQQISRHYQIISQKTHLRILRDDIQLDKRLSKLQIYWHNRNIPYFHRYYFLKCIFTAYLKTIPESIQKQQQLLKSQQHIYFSLFKSINARQSCLRHLKKYIAELTSQDVYQYLHVAKQRFFNQKRKNQIQKYKQQGYKLKLTEETQDGKNSKTKFQLFSDSFTHMVKLTLYVIQLIVKWKDYIRSTTHDSRKQKQRMEYYFYDDNYFLKILTDLGFLKVSFLNQFYTFAPKNDPFMLQCVLSFQKKSEKTIQHEFLKRIFMPPKQNIADIMIKLELLSQQYKYNIRSRKVYDLNILKNPISIMEQKQINNSPEIKSNLILKNIKQPTIKKAQSVKTFRIRQTSNNKQQNKKQKIIIQFKQPIKRKITNIPIKNQKQILDVNPNSPLKNSIILQKNQKTDLSTVDQKLIDFLKYQIIKKVKQQFKISSTKSHNHQNKALQLLIDNKVKQTMKNVFPFQPQKKLKQDIQFKRLTIKSQNLSHQIDSMFKQTIKDYSQMQYNSLDLLNFIQKSPFIYFIVASIGQQQIGRIICTLSQQSKQFKILKILYIHFTDVSIMQMLILQFVQFLWKHQNSFEIHFSFFLPSGNDKIQNFIQNLQNTLQKQCLFGRKQQYSTVTQVKLIFKRRQKNINYVPNYYPFSLRLQHNLVLSRKKLMLQNKNEHKYLHLVNYDYLMMQILKMFLSSQQILALKQKITWKNRLKIMIEMLQRQQQSQQAIRITHLQSLNITQLNNTLTKINHKYLQISDLVKQNKIDLLSIQLTLTPDYQIKIVNGINNENYYRISIKSKQTISVDKQNTEFYYLNCKQSRQYKLVIFSAKQYLNSNRNTGLYLNQYIFQRICKKQYPIQQIQRQISNLWIPNSRYPHKYHQRQDLFYHTVRSLDLTYLKLDVLLGQKLQWFCNIQMKNSLQYQFLQSDICIQPPYGIAVMYVPSKLIVYSRIFN